MGKLIAINISEKRGTEKKEIQRVMQQTERLVSIGQLMAGVAHEIRNPLACVRGFVQFLQKRKENRKRINRFAKKSTLYLIN